MILYRNKRIKREFFLASYRVSRDLLSRGWDINYGVKEINTY